MHLCCRHSSTGLPACWPMPVGDDHSPAVKDIGDAMEECGHWGAAAMVVCGKANIRQLLCEKMEDVGHDTPPMSDLVVSTSITSPWSPVSVWGYTLKQLMSFALLTRGCRTGTLCGC